MMVEKMDDRFNQTGKSKDGPGESAFERGQPNAAPAQSKSDDDRQNSPGTQLLQALPMAVFTTDHEGYLTLFNNAAALLWGKPPLLGQARYCGSVRLLRADGSVLTTDHHPVSRVLNQSKSQEAEELLLERPDGTRRNILLSATPLRDSEGRMTGAVGMLLDITETKQAKEASQRLAAIVESSDDAIISKDLDGTIRSWNRGAEQLFGYKAEEIIGQSVMLLIPPRHQDEEPRILARIRQGEPIDHYETVRRRKDGTLVEISLTISPVRDASGNIIGASKIVRDITRQKQAERKLEQAHQEALAASRAKDDFLAALSHELRTPLNPVLLLASEGAEDPQLPEHVRARFLTIRHNVELEARLIDDLLDITRITHSKLSMNLEPVEVHSVLRQAIAIIQADIQLKRIVLQTQFNAAPAWVNGDPVRLQQVFWNVIKNAVKFTPEYGEVRILTHIATSDEVTIEISDTGIGMTEQEIRQAFEAFAQGEHVKATGTHRFGGLGLGLAISHKLVELHGGKIVGSSSGRGQGSTFKITLARTLETRRAGSLVSIGSPSAKFPATGTPHGVGHPRVLLVEDHEATRIALTHLLNRRGYEVHTASTIAEARALASGPELQCLISDLDLPDGSGLGLFRELSAHHRGLKGIALSGFGMEADLARSKAAGFSVHLIKPVRMQSLEMALARLIPTSRTVPPAFESQATSLDE